MKRLRAFFSAFSLCSLCLTGTALSQSDFYIRSHFSNGKFVGSHEILTEPKKGYFEARYCERTFWVSSGTVVWTEEQNAAGMFLVLQENLGSSTSVVCSDNHEFATLDDLGLKERKVRQMRNVRAYSGVGSGRLQTIREAFKDFK
ncbi:hypothetical protein LP7551_02014 [Roseibium album]|nr:hypothetical protein LP7551_02014 [Roseibium album]